MVRCAVRDLMTVQKREITPAGYLVAPATLGRCGIQEYSRGELGMDGDPNAVVRLMRTPEEVFRPETIASFENVPITDDHPPAGVDAATWKTLSIGHARDINRGAGDLLNGMTFVMDGGGVAKVAGGKKATSCGYNFDLDLTPGTTPDGQAFDGFQRNILGDHLAIVDSPRGGPICRIGDKQKGTTMAMKKLAVDGLPKFEIDELAAEAIENQFKIVTGDRDRVVADLASHRTASKKAFVAKDAIIAEKDTAIKAKDAKIADLEGKLKSASAIDVDALVAERTRLLADAKVMAPELDAKGTSHEIRKAAIAVACADATNSTVTTKMLGGVAIDKATEQQVSNVFEVLLALPRQAALVAQDAAINRALGTGIDTAFGGGEIIGDAVEAVA